MPIPVVCPGCFKRFKVSDKFAGKTGPCPTCKTSIRIPTEAEEVKVHAPTQFGTGTRIGTHEVSAKPIARSEARWNSLTAAAISAVVVIVVFGAWYGGPAVFQDSFLARVVGLLLVSPPLVAAGYTFLRDSDDLMPYRGRWLYMRAVICSLVYMGLWAFYGYLAQQVLTGELWNWLFVLPPIFVAGASVALMSLDLEFEAGFFHFCFYVLATTLLGWTAGLGWPWEISNALTF